VLEGVRKATEEAGVRCQTRHIKDQRPAEGIIKAAKGQGCDLSSWGRTGAGR
jgi:hypothetical protein